jgi:tRNA nucleotidyltransferase/poly(A) polymerase
MPEAPGTRAQLQKLVREASAKGVGFSLVGGFVRDCLLGRESSDMDLHGSSGALEFVRDFALREGFRFQEIARYRRLRLQVNNTAVDVTEDGFCGPETGLAQRDFTVNAMALPLCHFLDRCRRHWQLSDPFNGLKDLRDRRLRALPGALERDPVRILRAARLCRRLGLHPDDLTCRTSRALAPSLRQAAVERIHGEFLSALRDEIEPYLQYLQILGADVPLLGYPGRQVAYLAHRMDEILSRGFFTPDVEHVCRAHLSQPLTAAANRRQILRLSALCLPQGSIVDVPFFLRAAKERHALGHSLAALCRLRQQGNPLAHSEMADYFLTYPDCALEGLLLRCGADGPAAVENSVEYLGALVRQSPLCRPLRRLSGAETAQMVREAGLPAAEIGKADRLLKKETAAGVIANLPQEKAYLCGYVNGKVLIYCRKNRLEEGMNKLKSNR